MAPSQSTKVFLTGKACCHHGAITDQEFCDGCMGCLVLWVQESILLVRNTMLISLFLTHTTY